MLLEHAYASFVNLDHRTDRLQRMEKSLAQIGLKATRTRGRMPNEFDREDPQYQVMWNRTPGAIGCHVSQCHIMMDALRQERHALVMEDDLMFCSDFNKRMAYIEQFTNENEWDIIWLGGTFHVNPPWWHKSTAPFRDAELTNNPRIVRTYGAFCTYAYLVNVTSIAKVLFKLDALVHTSMGIDWLMIQIQPSLKTFAFVPGCVRQYDNKSDIGKGDTIFSNFHKLGAHWYQDKMEDFDPTTYDWAEAGLAGPLLNEHNPRPRRPVGR